MKRFKSRCSSPDAYRATKNRDGDVVICGMHVVGNQTGAFAIKIRPDLQIDTLFNQSLTYDSLCAFPILTDTIIYDTTFVGIDDHFVEERTIEISPNPTSGKFVISYKSLQNESANLEIFDLFGNRVYYSVLPQWSSFHEVNFYESITNGMYVCRISNSKRLMGGKVIVER